MMGYPLQWDFSSDLRWRSGWRSIWRGCYGMSWILWTREGQAEKNQVGQEHQQRGCGRHSLAFQRVSGIGNLVAAFIGLLGLKVSAYLEPVMWRVTGHAAVQQNMGGEPFDR